jgi:hypothetical protein
MVCAARGDANSRKCNRPRDGCLVLSVVDDEHQPCQVSSTFAASAEAPHVDKSLVRRISTPCRMICICNL